MEENQPVQQQPQNASGAVPASSMAEPAANPGEQPPAPSGSKKAVVGVVVVIVILAAAWFGYQAYAKSPARVWQKFATRSNLPTVLSENFSVSYEDHGKADSNLQQNPGAAMLTNLKLHVGGTAYVDYRDAGHPNSTVNLDYSFGSGNTSMSSTAQVVMMDQVLYLNLGSNPFVSAMMAALSPGQKVDWLKIDLAELKKQAEQSGNASLSGLDFTQQVKDYQDIIRRHQSKYLTGAKYLGKETLRGQPTLHYANQLDKNELKSMLNELVDYAVSQAAAADKTMKPEDVTKAKDVAHTVINDFIDRVQITTLETWIGTTDYQLHKIKLVMSFPSVVSFGNLASQDQYTQELDKMSAQQSADKFLKDVAFDGQVSVENEFYDFGKTQDVKAPEQSVDLMQKIQEQKNQEMQLQQALPSSEVPNQ